MMRSATRKCLDRARSADGRVLVYRWKRDMRDVRGRLLVMPPVVAVSGTGGSAMVLVGGFGGSGGGSGVVVDFFWARRWTESFERRGAVGRM